MTVLLITKVVVLILLVYVHISEASSGPFDLLDLLLNENTGITTSTAGIPSVEPTAEPTAEPSSNPTVLPTTSPSAIPSIVPMISPSKVPTVAPTRPTVSPSLGPAFMSYDVSLKLTNATSAVLDSTAIIILQNSVANASQVRPSDVTLMSYTATASRRLVDQQRSLQQSAQLRSFSFIPQLPSESASNGRSLRMSSMSADSYTISAICAIRVALADYPQYNGNITALYVSLTNNLLQAVSDNSLTNTIRVLSVQANSITFQYINGVEVLEITLPLAEGFPTTMPTAAPNHISGPKYHPGEIAGMIIALMVGLAVFVIAMYYLITYRKSERSEVYLYVEPASPLNSPIKSENVTMRNKQLNTRYEHDEIVDL